MFRSIGRIVFSFRSFDSTVWTSRLPTHSPGPCSYHVRAFVLTISVLYLVGYVDRLCGEAGDDSIEKSWRVAKQSWRMSELGNRLVDQDCLIEQYKLALGDRDKEIDNMKRVST